MEQLRPQIGTSESTSQAGPTCCGVFGLRWPEDTSLLLPRLADVAALARQVRAITDALPREVEAREMLGPFDQVEHVIMNLGSVGRMTVFQLMHPMTDAGWQSLRTAEILLRQHAREPVIADDKIAELRKQTQQLISDVSLAEDLETQTKSWLLDRLREVREALENVELLGYPGVERVYDRTLGSLVRAPNLFARIAASKAAAGFVLLMSMLSSAVSSAEGISQLLAPPSSPEQIQVIVNELTCAQPSTSAPSGLSPADIETVDPRPDDEDGDKGRRGADAARH